MIGVASRNANRAASLFESPTSRPPPIVAPEREKPGISASAWAAPIAERSAPARPAWRSARRRRSSVCGARRRRQLGAVEEEPVQHQEDRRATRARRSTWRSLCSSSQAEDAGWDRPDDRAARRAWRRCRPGSIPRSRRLRPRPLTIRTQSLPEEAEQDERGGEVRRDEEGEEVRVVLVDVPAEQARQDHAVAEARDREELGDALQQAEHDRLPVRDELATTTRRSGLSAGPLRRRSGTRRRSKQRDADEERRDSVLDVVVARSRLVAGQPRGEASSPARPSSRSRGRSGRPRLSRQSQSQADCSGARRDDSQRADVG